MPDTTTQNNTPTNTPTTNTTSSALPSYQGQLVNGQVPATVASQFAPAENTPSAPTSTTGGDSDTPAQTAPAPSAQPTTSPSQQIADKFTKTLSTLQGGKTPPPSTAGAATAAVQGAVPPPQPPAPDINSINSALGTNPAIQDFIQQTQDTFSKENQLSSLTNDYQNLVNSSGLQGINTQLLNIQNIMNGTEDDIKDEITKAGGFATQSQVMALTTARNKGMIQNYNNLLNTQKDIQTQVSTMIGLDEKDKATAVAQLDKQLGVSQQIATMTTAASKNTMDALSAMQKTEGWDGIYKAALASGDPQAIERINQTMGQGFDLATMASQDEVARTNAQAKDTEALAVQNSTIAKNSSDIAKNNADIRHTDALTSGTQYDIAPNDTLTTIANKIGTTPEALQAANPNIDENNLQVGQTLALPPKSQTGKAVTSKLPTAAQLTQKINTSIGDPRFAKLSSSQKADFIHKMGGDPTKFHY